MIFLNVFDKLWLFIIVRFFQLLGNNYNSSLIIKLLAFIYENIIDGPIFITNKITNQQKKNNNKIENYDNPS